MASILLAERAFAPEELSGPVAIVVSGGVIDSVWPQADITAVRAHVEASQVIDLRPWRVAPGYIDLHTHGFMGHDVTAGSADDIRAMAGALPSSGVTAFLPTVASTGRAETLRQVRSIASAMRSADARAAEILGVRLEGPFINPRKKGAQHEAAIRAPDRVELEELAASGAIRIVDFAPEMDPGLQLLAALVRLRIVASIGHTEATYDQAVAALDGGARHCTHLFNAMPPLEHRAPGVAGALLTDQRASVEVIADGVHLHPAALKLVVAARGPDAVALITDAVVAAGMPEGEYTFVGRPVVVANGGVRLPDGTLAGSVLTLDRAVRNMVTLAGVSWSAAIHMATSTPATIAGVADRKGGLRRGADADLVVLDADGTVRQTWRAGALLFAA